MPFDDLNRYTPNHKPWDHVGNIIPDIEHSEGERPHLGDGGQVAAWLPVQFFDKYYENWMVVMPGKAVALDPDGKLMPAEYGLTSASVVYTQNDIDAGTIDIATGLAVTTAKTVVLSELTGEKDASWTAATAGTTGVTSGFMGRYGVSFNDSTKKYSIGVAPYAYLKWAGGDGFNPAEYLQHNYNMQHRVAVLCDYVIKLPLIPAQAANESIDKTATGSALTFGSQNVYTRANAILEAYNRYNSTTGTYPVLTTYPVIALALANQNVARNTARTTFALSSTDSSDDLSGVLTNERTALSAVTQAGDYWVDYEKGVIFVYSADGATLPTQISGATGTPRITYYHNGSAPSTLSKFACVLAGDIKPGDFVKTGTGSNLVKATPASDKFVDIVGQVICLETHPQDSLDRVRTAYNPAIPTDASGSMANAQAGSSSTNTGQMDQMPGSATGGYPDLIHYAGAADTICIINLISR